MLSLPDSGKHGDLKGKVMDGCNYGGQNGLENVKAFLNLHIGQDSVSEVVDKIKTFMGVTRKPEQTVREYVSNFESSYSLAKSKAKMAGLPPLFLKWVLTENANISEQDKKLVLFGVDLDKPEEIYESTKKALLKYCGNDSSPSSPAGTAAGLIFAPKSTFFSGKNREFNNFRGRGRSRPRGDDQNFDPEGYPQKLDRSNLMLDGKKVNANKNGLVMTCDFFRSFLHLWKDCRDRKEHRETRKSKAYANIEEFDTDGYEQGDEGDARHDDEVTQESEAFIAHHLADLGLAKPSNLPRSTSKKNLSWNFYMDTNTKPTSNKKQE